MDEHELIEGANRFLHRLCVEIPTRRVGSDGNREATDFFIETISGFGFSSVCLEFDCFDWEHGEVSLTVEGSSFEAFASPYSLGCDLHAQLEAACSLAELDALDLDGKIVLLYGEIAKGQLMPKDFPFFYPEEHKQIIDILETKEPDAIIAATGRDPGMAGAMHPFNLFEDGNFNIPSVYMTDNEGERLYKFLHQEITLMSEASRIPSMGCNPVARRGKELNKRIVLTAHIDAKIGTPGAIDNAGGVVTLLTVANLLQDYKGSLTVELVAFNGEDYYSAPGQIEYIRKYASTFPEILLAINLDGLGYVEGKTATSLYNCPTGVTEIVEKVFASHNEFVQGDSWYQSDHSIFIQNEVPAMAITTDQFSEVWAGIAHTEKDTPDIVDTSKLVRAAQGLRDLILELDKQNE
ncbi:MAG: M28 family peptidase [Anaerolineales bacterium]